MNSLAFARASSNLAGSETWPWALSSLPPPLPPMASSTAPVQAFAETLPLRSFGTTASTASLPPALLMKNIALVVHFLDAAPSAKATALPSSKTPASTTPTYMSPEALAASSAICSPISLAFFSTALASALPPANCFSLSLSMSPSIFRFSTRETSLSVEILFLISAIFFSSSAPMSVLASSTSTERALVFSVASTAACGPVTATMRLTPLAMPSSTCKTNL
mmetsp:Transcript_42448/g.96566  ORF Transcript_42448/g.96566 Transcript_42448/m.96566 type:complete len:222 (+) Transcript_42448:33-698(+)